MNRIKATRRKLNYKMLEYKLHRLRQTLSKIPEYADVFRFFEKLVRLRHKYTAVLRDTIPGVVENGAKARARLQEGLPLMDKNNVGLDLDCMKIHFAVLFDLISANSPLDLDFMVSALHSDPDRPLYDVIEEIIRYQPTCRMELIQFMINETVNPVLEIYAKHYKEKMRFDQWREGFCPVCGGVPGLGVILPDSGRRRLVCRNCCAEWNFPRIKCPFCGNEDRETLSYLKIDQDNGHRIEVCNVCRYYLKTLTPSAPVRFPLYDIENVATLHLDIIAGRQGYLTASLPFLPENSGL